MRLILAVLLVVPWYSQQELRAEAINSDDVRVENAYKNIQDFQIDKGIAQLTGPYVEAMSRGDYQRAARYLTIIGLACRFDENRQAYLHCSRQAAALDPKSTTAAAMTEDAFVSVNRYAEAEKQLQTLLPLADKDAYVARCAGNFYLAQDDPLFARKYFQISENLDGTSSLVHRTLSTLLSEKQQCMNEARLAVSCAPTEYLKQMYLFQAQTIGAQSGDPKPTLKRAAAMAPGDPGWRTIQAAQLGAANRTASAKHMMRQAMNCKRACWPAILQLVGYSIARGDTHLAESALRFADKINSSSASAWYMKGQLCQKLGDYPGAQRNYRQALAIKPKQAMVYMALLQLPAYLKSEQLQNELVKQWQQACPHNTQTWLYDGGRLLVAQRYKQAIPSFDEAEHLLVQLDPLHQRQDGAWQMMSADRGVCHYKLGETQQALSDAVLFNSLKSDGGWINVRLPRINYSELSGKKKMATEHALLADMLFQINEMDDCIAEYKQAIATDDDIQWHRGLLKAYMEKRDAAGAAQEDLMVSNHALTRDIPETAQRLWRQLTQTKQQNGK
jgi:tetratricopeptide (TPR) repeat protein